MSNYWSDYQARYQRAALTTACEKCGAKVGEACKTKSGLPSITPHLYRSRRAHAAVRSAK